ncbi:hypothetical protein [Caballeronia arationis]|jgi:hypothetical protein|nr:hypothetical protein [Caballeronia arationis]
MGSSRWTPRSATTHCACGTGMLVDGKSATTELQIDPQEETF